MAQGLGTLFKITNTSKSNIPFRSKFSIIIFPMRHNSESILVKLVISENSVVFEDINLVWGFSFQHEETRLNFEKSRKIGIYVTT